MILPKKRATYICGIDPSSAKLAATITTKGNPVVDQRVGKLATSNKHRACGQAYLFMQEIIEDYEGYELLVYIEKPFSSPKFPGAGLVLSRIIGALSAACFVHDVDSYDVQIQQWKKGLTGNGNAGKPLVAQTVARLWPVAFEQAKGDQDVLDSCGINRYGEAQHQRALKIQRLKYKMKEGKRR